MLKQIIFLFTLCLLINLSVCAQDNYPAKNKKPRTDNNKTSYVELPSGSKLEYIRKNKGTANSKEKYPNESNTTSKIDAYDASYSKKAVIQKSKVVK